MPSLFTRAQFIRYAPRRQKMLLGAMVACVVAILGTAVGAVLMNGLTAVAPPTLTAGLGPAGVTLEWTMPGGRGYDHMAIYRNHQYLAYARTPGYVDADVVAGTSYAYSIVPIDDQQRTGQQSNIARVLAPSVLAESTTASQPSATPATPSPTARAKPAASPRPAGQAAVVAAGAGQFVTRKGTQLYLAGQPYRFTGFNIYHANSRDNCGPTLGEGQALDTALAAIGPDKTVMRAWFFQNLATTNGARDWQAFDHTLKVAQAHGVRIIATLGNQWGECERGSFKPASWYQSGYRSDSTGGIVSYRAWVQEVVSRYRGNPTIMAWQLMNEAETSASQNGGCVSNSAAILRAFADDVGGLVHSLDRNHLVSLGTIGSGQCGASGGDYQYVHASPGIDLCEYHDYDDSDGLPGDEWNGLRVRINQCRELGKPLFVGELGARPNEVGGTFGARANLFARKIGASFDAGVVGELVWNWMGQSTIDDYDVGPGDPVIKVLGQF